MGGVRDRELWSSFENILEVDSARKTMHAAAMTEQRSELTRFASVKAGDTVVDVFPGKGDWTRAFSDVVGKDGTVYAFVPGEVTHLGDLVGNMEKLAKEPGRENVKVVSSDLVAPPTGPLDVVWVNLFYHDLHTPLGQARGATADAFNRAVFERLKSGGFYVIVDHVATAGAGASQAASLHRIEPSVVRAEVEKAGFVLDEESKLLANASDSHTVRVFDASIKGTTDRIAYRFVKP